SIAFGESWKPTSGSEALRGPALSLVHNEDVLTTSPDTGTPLIGWSVATQVTDKANHFDLDGRGIEQSRKFISGVIKGGGTSLGREYRVRELSGGTWSGVLSSTVEPIQLMFAGGSWDLHVTDLPMQRVNASGPGSLEFSAASAKPSSQAFGRSAQIESG